jgi:hypothetical protein
MEYSKACNNVIASKFTSFSTHKLLLHLDHVSLLIFYRRRHHHHHHYYFFFFFTGATTLCEPWSPPLSSSGSFVTVYF